MMRFIVSFVVMTLGVSICLEPSHAAPPPPESKAERELRVALATCELQRATLAKRVEAMEQQLVALGYTNELKDRAEAAENRLQGARADVASLSAKVTSLKLENQKLREENQKLQEENEQLIRLVSAKTPVPPQPAPSPVAVGGWQVVETTMISGTVQQIKHGTLFKTATGNVYEVTDFVLELVLLLNPQVTVLTDGISYKLIIDGVSKPLLCKGSAAAGGATASVVESRIDGEFTGFEMGRVFKLRNGQIWEQVSARYTYRYKFAPEVMIWKDGAQYKMKVDGTDDAIVVRRLN